MPNDKNYYKSGEKLGTVAYTCGPSYLDAEAGGSFVSRISRPAWAIHLNPSQPPK